MKTITAIPTKKKHSLKKQLTNERKLIDRFDSDLIEALAFRFVSVKKIGAIKESLGLPLIQKKRWAQILKKRLNLAQQLGLDRHFVAQLMNLIHAKSLSEQKSLRRNVKVSKRKASHPKES